MNEISKKISKTSIKKNLKKVLALFAVVMIMGAMAVPCFAADGDSEAVSAVKAGFTQVTGTISIANVLQVLAIVLGVAFGFFFFWWGIRKVIRVASKAFKNGRVSV